MYQNYGNFQHIYFVDRVGNRIKNPLLSALAVCFIKKALIKKKDCASFQGNLYILQTLNYTKKCWAVVQPILFPLFMPKSFNETTD